MPKAKTYGPLLLHRFGPDLLRDGYKITPDALDEEYRLRLHLSTGEVRLIVYLWNKWKLYEEKISLPVKAIAGALYLSASQVRRYIHALKEKGLLDVSCRPGRGRHNWYDLRPLCEKLRALVRGFPLPRRRGEVTTRPYKNASVARPKLSYVKEELWASMDSISRQFHDTAPKSSLTRAARIWFKLGLPLEAYKVWIQEARQRTKDFWAGVEKPMPYFFAILEQGPHARIDQAKEEPAAPASPIDGAAFFWDDGPLPAMEQPDQAVTVEAPDQQEQPKESDQTVLTAIGPDEAMAITTPAISAPSIEASAPVSIHASREPRFWSQAIRLQYPHLEIIADGSEYEIVLDGLESWQTFLRMSSPAEQRRAEQKLSKMERGAIGRASAGRRAPGRYRLAERPMIEAPTSAAAPVSIEAPDQGAQERGTFAALIDRIANSRPARWHNDSAAGLL